MPNLVGAPDTRKVRRCVMVKSGNAAIESLRKRVAVCAADDKGAIQAYDDKFGKYRCGRFYHFQVLENETFTSLTAVRKWFTAALKKIA